MKKQSVKKNFIFQILYQLIILGLPLILSPYLTRTLGENELGIYTFTYSIGYYFVVAAMLGIMKYGQRIIASRKQDETALRRTFWSLYITHFIISSISLLAYLIFAFLQVKNRNIYLLQAVYVASALFDITWLFYGMENFKSIVIKNFFVKIVSTVLIFVFVKNVNDLWIYTLIMSISVFVGHFIMVPQAISIIKPIRFNLNDMIEHIKPLFVLSVAVIAATLYTIFDKTLIGIFIDEKNVAYYEYAHKIIQIPIAVITVIGTVLFPRSCACYAAGDENGMKKYFSYALVFTYFIGFASIFGLLAIADLLIYEYYGENFLPSIGILKSQTPIILFLCLGDIVRTQFLIPMGKDKSFIVIAILNAIVNIILTCILLPLIGVYGAVVGTVFAELFGTVCQSFICRKRIDFKVVIKYIFPFALAGLAMFGIIELLKTIYNVGIFALIIQILVGGLIYCIISVLLLTLIDRNIIFNFFKKNKE